MKKEKRRQLEPDIYRQRLLVEGHYTAKLTTKSVKGFLGDLSDALDMRIFAGPFAWPPDEWTNPEVTVTKWNCFVAWTASGAQMYIWREEKFFTLDVYSCKPFDSRLVVKMTREAFGSTDMVSAAY